MTRWLRVGLAGAWLVVAGWPAAVQAETLADALVQAYQTNPTLAAQRTQLRATNELMPQALSGYRPEARINSDVGVEYGDTDTADADTRTPFDVQLSVVQPIYRGGRTTADVARARSLIESERARLFDVEQQVLLDGVTVYMDVARDSAVLELAINNLSVIARQLQATQDRFEVGEVTRTDVAQAESRLAGAVADRIRAEGDLISSRAAYRRVVGADPGTLAPPDPLAGLPASEAMALDIATTDHPTLIAAGFVDQAARHDIRVAEGALLPEVNLRSSVDQAYDQSNFVDRETSASVRLELTIPLYQSGLRESQVRESKYIAAQRRFEIDEARRFVLEDVTRAWEDLSTGNAQVEAFQQSVRAAEIALEGLEKEAMVGSRTVLDVLDGEQELFQARVDLVRAQRDVLVASYRLQSAIGHLSAEALGLPVAIYDIEGPYQRTRRTWWGTGVDIPQ